MSRKSSFIRIEGEAGLRRIEDLLSIIEEIRIVEGNREALAAIAWHAADARRALAAMKKAEIIFPPTIRANEPFYKAQGWL